MSSWPAYPPCLVTKLPSKNECTNGKHLLQRLWFSSINIWKFLWGWGLFSSKCILDFTGFFAMSEIKFLWKADWITSKQACQPPRTTNGWGNGRPCLLHTLLWINCGSVKQFHICSISVARPYVISQMFIVLRNLVSKSMHFKFQVNTFSWITFISLCFIKTSNVI